MSLPSSGNLSLSQIRTEFGGGSPPANLRAYLRGGSYVRYDYPWDYAPNVAFSGNLSIRQFLGACKNHLSVSLSTTTCHGERTGAGTCWTNYVDVTASGGSGSYTYTWNAEPGYDTGWTVQGTTHVRFQNYVTLDIGKYAVYSVTVTDSVFGFTVASAFIDVDIIAF